LNEAARAFSNTLIRTTNIMESITITDAIRELSPHRDAEFVLVSVRPDATLGDTLHKLQGYKVTAVPVLENHTAQALRTAHMVDLLDLAGAIAESGDNPQVLETPVGRLSSSTRLPLVHSDTCLADAVKMMQAHPRAHHLLVLDQGSDRPIAILSQTDIIKWALIHSQHLPHEVMTKPVRGLKCSTHVVSAKHNESMKEALHRFIRHEKSGMAVVDEDGRMIANLSLADLRGLTHENARRLLSLNVNDFLRVTRQSPKEPVTCTSSTTMSEVMHLIRKHHVHRVYVTDEQGRPVGVISSSNVIANM